MRFQGVRRKGDYGVGSGGRRWARTPKCSRFLGWYSASAGHLVAWTQGRSDLRWTGVHIDPGLYGEIVAPLGTHLCRVLLLVLSPELLRAYSRTVKEGFSVVWCKDLTPNSY